jgi:hypothetical protein
MRTRNKNEWEIEWEKEGEWNNYKWLDNRLDYKNIIEYVKKIAIKNLEIDIYYAKEKIKEAKADIKAYTEENKEDNNLIRTYKKYIEEWKKQGKNKIYKRKKINYQLKWESYEEEELDKIVLKIAYTSRWYSDDYYDNYKKADVLTKIKVLDEEIEWLESEKQEWRSDRKHNINIFLNIKKWLMRKHKEIQKNTIKMNCFYCDREFISKDELLLCNRCVINIDWYVRGNI